MRAYLLLFGFVVGCSNAPGTSDEWGDVLPIEQTLSFSDECDLAPADATIYGVGSVFSGHSYGTTQCHAGYVVDVNAYSGADRDSAIQGGVTRWADSPPSTEATCEKAQVLSYLWAKVSGEYEVFQKNIGYGVWIPGIEYCAVPRVVNPNYYQLQIGASYRFGISARQINSAGTGYGTRVVALDIQ